MMTPMKRSGMRGMTLVEILVVMVIMLVVVAAVMSLYLPVQQSTVVQTQVSDVQDNLRVAVKAMTDDLLTAGFLMAGQDPIVFDPGAPGNDQDFTIRTRLLGKAFARVENLSFNTLVVRQQDMVDAFPVGTRVRLYEPIAAVEIDEATQPDAALRVYTVTAVSKVHRTITLNDVPGGTAPEAVLVKVRNTTDAPVQTIRYRFNNGALERIINQYNADGSLNANRIEQVLARSIGGVSFNYSPLVAGDPIRRVDITLTGLTQAGAKTRELRTSVTLRNVF